MSNPRTRMLMIAISILFASCSAYRASDRWYAAAPAADDAPDLFYLCSTVVADAPDGSHRAQLSADERAIMRQEIDYVRAHLADSSQGFYAPYYRQLTFSAYQLPADSLPALQDAVADDVVSAFRYYLKHYNGGRRYVLVGFSQGAMLLPELLRAMSDEEYSRCVAAYMIGAQLTPGDLVHPHIRAAQDASDTGVAVTFNSVRTPDAIWPLVAGQSAACINPVNWQTDATPATFEYEGQDATVHVDTSHHVLIVDVEPEPYHAWMQAHPIFKQLGVSDDCLHHWDLLFYLPQLRANIQQRSQRP